MRERKARIYCGNCTTREFGYRNSQRRKTIDDFDRLGDEHASDGDPSFENARGIDCCQTSEKDNYCAFRRHDTTRTRHSEATRSRRRANERRHRDSWRSKRVHV